MIERWLRPDEVERAFAGLKESWDELLSVLQVETPDEDTNRMVNTWNPYQCMATFNLSRSMSAFESGIGRGMGFRDSSQDLLGCSALVPARARERILDLAATQLPSGGAYHQYQPLTKRGNDQIGSGFNDDPLWLVLAASAYLKETGDLAVLDELVPYDNRAGSETAALEHLQRCVQLHPRPARAPRPAPDRPRRLERLPQPELLLRDTGRVIPDDREPEGGVAESLFIAGQFVLAANELAAIARLRGANDDDAERYESAPRDGGQDRGARLGRRVVPPRL